MALSLSVLALFSTSGAHPEVFGYHPVDSITSAADESGEVEWTTSDMIIGKGWRPTTYDEQMVRMLFGEPKSVAPNFVAWAFAYEGAPDFGVMLVPTARGVVVPALWDRGMIDLDHWGRGARLTGKSSSAWLNALADFQREVLHTPPATDPHWQRAAPPPTPGADMQTLALTPDDLAGLTKRIAAHEGPVAVADLGAWSDADLDAVRVVLSSFDLRHPAVIDGQAGTLDGLVDRLVAELGRLRGHEAVRAHRPELWSEAERARIEAAMDPDEDPWFYIDGEPEVMDSGLMFDVYEPYIWSDMY